MRDPLKLVSYLTLIYDRCRELFDDFSVHQFYSLFRSWNEGLLSPADLVSSFVLKNHDFYLYFFLQAARVIHIIADALYNYDPNAVGDPSFDFTSEQLKSYFQESILKKKEFYFQFCEHLPDEIQEDIRNVGLFEHLLPFGNE